MNNSFIEKLSLWWKQKQDRSRVKVQRHPLFRSFPKSDLQGDVWQRFEKICHSYPDRDAIDSLKGPVSYRQLWKRASAVRQAVIELEPEENSTKTVAILMQHGPAMIPAILGVVGTGMAYIFLNPTTSIERLRFILSDSAAAILITEKQYVPLIEKLKTSPLHLLEIGTVIKSFKEKATGSKPHLPCDSDTAFCITYTSGSSGTPSGVIRSHRAVLSNIRNVTNLACISPADRVVCLTSPTFGAAIISLFGALLNGACVLTFDVGRKSVDDLPAWIGENGITFYHSVPTLFRSLALAATSPSELASIRHILLGGEQVYAADLEAFKRLFSKHAVLQNVLGLTESAGVVCSYLVNHKSPPEQHTLPVGYPVSGHQISIIDDGGRQLPPGTPGEIVVRSQSLSKGYLNQTEATLRKFKHLKNQTAERQLHTGDLGKIRTEDGALVWLGRKDGQIKINGVRINILEIEAALLRLPSVAEAAVTFVGQEGDQTGATKSRLIAWVVLTSGSHLTWLEMQQHLLNHLPVNTIPSQLVLIDVMPVLPNGKVDRRSLNPSHPAAAKNLPSWHVAPRNALEEMVAAAFANALGKTSISVYDHFFEMGGDSLAAVQMLSSLSQTLGFNIPAGVLLGHPTVAILAETIPTWAAAAKAHEQPHLNSDKLGSGNSLLITLRDQGRQAPMYICPGGHGTENELLVFARMLATTNLDRPVYGFRLSALLEQLPAMPSLTDMATEVMRSILNHRPNGPWVLLGECVAGATAVEVARLIQQVAPERMPEQVILLDSRTNEYLQRHGSPQKIKAVIIPRLEQYFRLLLDWKTQPFDFPVHLIVSEEYASAGPDPTLGWQDFCFSSVSTYRVPGSHHGYLRQHASSVAASIQQILAHDDANIS